MFLPNRAQFLVRTGTIPLAKVMRRLLTGYAVGFKRRHKRYGRLFQNRYKSIGCQEEVYLRELVRYIHLHPVTFPTGNPINGVHPIRAGTVRTLSELNSYPYSGHSAVMRKKRRPWQDADKVRIIYEVERLGYDLDRVAARAAEIYGMEVDAIFLKGKQQKRVEARRLFCSWAARELGISLTA